MNEYIHKQFTVDGLTVKIIQDQDATNPQEDHDTGLFLVANHRDFYVPEPGEKRVPNTFDELVERYGKTHWIIPIEAYIHGDVRLALSHEGNFVDRQWDVSQVGAIFAAKSEWRLRKKARKVAENYVETWNQYLSGDVWGVVVEDESGNELDACWGFYGSEYAEQEGKSMAKGANKHRASEACLI